MLARVTTAAAEDDPTSAAAVGDIKGVGSRRWEAQSAWSDSSFGLKAEPSIGWGAWTAAIPKLGALCNRETSASAGLHRLMA
ncbi:hypothetical protein DV096_07655 [Bradymonadaceae bacterium TMQ3]|nr:hypothetical protein DV096_07655 [Bradymonadaceae bacterium TMQ3]